MMEKCFDEGVLQAFLDNELVPELSQKVARHVAACDSCAVLLTEVEEETALVFAALEEEFNTLVPTHRLWTKINQSIEVECRRRSLWQNVSAFVSGFSLTNPSVAAFASLVFVVAVVATLITLKPEAPVAVQTKQEPKIASPSVQPAATSVAQTAPPEIETPDKQFEKKQDPAPPQYAIRNASFSEDNRKASYRAVRRAPRNDDFAPQVTRLDYLPGEETYLSAIARLESTVNRSKDEVLKPSARFSYEKNMAVVNDAIRKMKLEVRKNPKNEAAKQVLFASYQNKIDLLNSVTERSELLASLR